MRLQEWSALEGLRERNVWFFILYSAIFHLGVLGLADIVLNFYFVSLGHDTEVIGLLQAMPRLAGLITSIPLGLLATRVGSRRMVLWATAGLCAAMLLKVLVPTLPALAAGQFLHGLFYGAQQIAIAPLMVTLVPAAALTRFFALHNVISMTAMAFGSFVGGRMPAFFAMLFSGGVAGSQAFTDQSPLAYGATILSAIVVVLGGLLPFWWVRGAAPATQSTAPARQSQRPPWLYLAFVSLPMLTFGFTGGLTFPFYNLFFRSRFALPDEAVGTILSIGWMGMALLPLTNLWWERRFGRVWALGLMLSIASVAFWIMGMAPVVSISVIAFTIAISFRNVLLTLYQPLLFDHLPVALHNLASSMINVMWNLGWFGATLISGFWQKTYGFGFIFNVVTAGVFLTAVSVVWIFYNRRTYTLPEIASEAL